MHHHALVNFQTFYLKKKNVVFKVTVPHSLSILFVLGKTHYNTEHKSSQGGAF